MYMLRKIVTSNQLQFQPIKELFNDDIQTQLIYFRDLNGFSLMKTSNLYTPHWEWKKTPTVICYSLYLFSFFSSSLLWSLWVNKYFVERFYNEIIYLFRLSYLFALKLVMTLSFLLQFPIQWKLSSMHLNENHFIVKYKWNCGAKYFK